MHCSSVIQKLPNYEYWSIVFWLLTWGTYLLIGRSFVFSWDVSPLRVKWNGEIISQWAEKGVKWSWMYKRQQGKLGLGQRERNKREKLTGRQLPLLPHCQAHLLQAPFNFPLRLSGGTHGHFWADIYQLDHKLHSSLPLNSEPSRGWGLGSSLHKLGREKKTVKWRLIGSCPKLHSVGAIYNIFQAATY